MIRLNLSTDSVWRMTLGSLMSPVGGVYAGPFNSEKLVPSFEVYTKRLDSDAEVNAVNT